MTKGQYPTISKGLGNLTPDLWRRLMVMLDMFEKNNRDESGGAFKKSSKSNMFLAQLNDYELISGEDNRYHYGWEEINITSVNTVELKVGGRSGSIAEGTQAINLCEVPNTDVNVAPSVDLEGAVFPSGFGLRPIGECIDTEWLYVPVVMHKILDTSGVPRYVFSLANSIDGDSC